MANVLSPGKQETIIKCLVDGTSIRATERITDVHRDTIMRLLVRVGKGCAQLLDEEMRGLPCKRIEVDEVWTFVSKKERRLTESDDRFRMGDQWVYVAIDSETKAIPAYFIGKRSRENTMAFLRDLAGRLDNRVQLSSDAMMQYIEAVQWAFGQEVDYAQIVKSYEAEPIGPGRYAPPKVASVAKTQMIGAPEPLLVSTSFVERQNLTMRMSMNRLTRLTLGFSKKLENLQAATALHFAAYNFVKLHRTIKTTPAMAIGVAYRPWTVGDLLDVVLSN